MTYVLRAPVNYQIEVILLLQAQGFAHVTCLIRISSDVNLPTIWTKTVPYSFSGTVQMVMVMVAWGSIRRRSGAIN